MKFAAKLTLNGDLHSGARKKIFHYIHLKQTETVPREKLLKRRRIFRKIFCSMQNFLELQCLVDGLDEVDMRFGYEDKNILLQNIY